MVDTSVTIFGNLTRDPDLSNSNGTFRGNFRVASTERRWDRESGLYVDGAKVFISVTCWRTLAENMAGSLKKGDPVVVIGRLRQHSYVNPAGQTVNLTEIDADVVAVDLRRGMTSRLRKVARNAEADHSFDTARPDDAGVSAHDGMSGIDGASTDGASTDGASTDGASTDGASMETELHELVDEELVGAATEQPF